MKKLKSLKGMKKLSMPGQRTPEARQRTGLPPKVVEYKPSQRKVWRRTLKDFPPPTPQPTPCVLWQGAADRYGYGAMKFYIGKERKTYKVHRWAWEQVYGVRLKPEQVLLHMCDNPPCYRISHLRVGTLADNNADMLAKGRAAKPPVNIMRGYDSPSWKWTPEKESILAIMKEYGYPAEDIAEVVGLHKATVNRYIKQKREEEDAHGNDKAEVEG